MNTTHNIRKTPANSITATLLLVVFILIALSASSVPMMRLKMNGTNSLDETVVYYQSGATAGFDSNFDAYKLFGPTPAPHISQQFGSLLMSVNGIDPASPSFSIQVKVTTPLTGNFTITAADFEEFPINTPVFLKDLSTGLIIDIRTNPYTFLLNDTTSASRFILTIGSSVNLLENNRTNNENSGKEKIHLTDRGNNTFQLSLNTNVPNNELFIELLSFSEGNGNSRKFYQKLDGNGKMLLDFAALKAGIYALMISSNNNRIGRAHV